MSYGHVTSWRISFVGLCLKRQQRPKTHFARMSENANIRKRKLDVCPKTKTTPENAIFLACLKTPTFENTIRSYLRKHQRPKTQLVRMSENDKSPNTQVPCLSENLNSRKHNPPKSRDSLVIVTLPGDRPSTCITTVDQTQQNAF